jgi:hypothetical protein
MRGEGGSCGVSANEYSCVHHVTWSPNKLLRSTSIFNLCPLPIPGGDEGRNGFGGPPGTGGPGGGGTAGNELGIDLSGEIWVETPADGGEQNTSLNYLVPSNKIFFFVF